MCSKKLLGLPSAPKLPEAPAIEQTPEEKPAVFETNQGKSPKRGRDSLKREDLTTGSGTGLGIPQG